MRTKRDTPMIGVCCGHRVPRVPVPRTDGRYGNVYWCEACGTHRMSGGKPTGERGFDFLLELRDEIERRQIVVSDPGTEHGRLLVAALGAQYSPDGGRKPQQANGAVATPESGRGLR